MMTKAGQVASSGLHPFRAGVANLLKPYIRDAKILGGGAYLTGRGLYSYGIRPAGHLAVRGINALGRGAEHTSDFLRKHYLLTGSLIAPAAIASQRAEDSFNSTISYTNPDNNEYSKRPGFFFNTLERNTF